MINHKQLVQDVIDGEESSLKAYAILKEIKDDIDKSFSIIKEIALEDSNKYNKEFEESGYQFERRNGGILYDFSEIPEWKYHNDKIKKIEERAKYAYKAYENKLQLLNDDEIVKIPKTSYRKDSLLIKKNN